MYSASILAENYMLVNETIKYWINNNKFIYMLFFIIYCLSIIWNCFHWPPCDLKNIRFCALAQISALHGVASDPRCILYFQEIWKNMHLWPSLTDENDSLLLWLRRSPLYFICKCLFFRQSKWLMSPISHLTAAPASWCRCGETFYTSSR